MVRAAVLYTAGPWFEPRLPYHDPPRMPTAMPWSPARSMRAASGSSPDSKRHERVAGSHRHMGPPYHCRHPALD